MNETHYHVGILVHDLDVAIPRFEDLLGMRFLPPLEVGPFVSGETARITYSLEGPPYIELVEATGTGVLSPALGEGFHHLGISDPDAPARCRTLEAADVPGAPLLVDGEGAVVTAFSDPAALFGVRLEIVGAAARARFEERIRAARSG